MDGLKGINATRTEQPFDSDEMLRRIASGNAVLFLGAGFSFGSTSVGSDKLSTASVIADQLGSIAGFQAEGDLRYAAEKFRQLVGAQELVDFLRSAFSVAATTPDHQTVASLEWRRVYTTNYDLAFERAAESSGRVVSTVDLSQHPSEHLSQAGACVHINGSLRSLSIESLDGPFKLTNHSYLAPDAIAASQWSYPFKRDLEEAACIVFVGYSLYDIEIQRVLFGAPHFRTKTYFVCRKGEPERNTFLLSEFGAVLPYGLDWFANLIRSEISKYQKGYSGDEPRLFDKYEVARAQVTVRDADVATMLMHGDIKDSVVDSSVYSDQGAPLLVIRDEISTAEKQLEAGRSVVIVGDFGNGKTLATRILKSKLASQGFAVYSADESDSAQFSDLELLTKRQGLVFLFIDDFESNLELVQHFCILRPNNVRLVLSARTARVERVRKDLAAWGLDFVEVPVDELSNDEVTRLVEIFDGAGLWGDLASLSPSAKANRIIQKNRRQLSLALLEILESPQVKARVADLLGSLLPDKSHKATVFSIALLQVVGNSPHISMVSEVAGNNAIYEPGLRLNESFKSIFDIQGSRVSTKSNLFALSMIRGHFTAPYVVDELLRVAEKFGNDRGLPAVQLQIFKEIRKFSVVERMLPGGSSAQKKANLMKYYEELKRRVPWLKSDPHYWLQYSMAQMNFDDYKTAQQYLDVAYALAEKRDNYHTAQFDTQQARMWLDMSEQSSDPVEAYKLFSLAHDLLRKVDSDLHKYWQFNRYADVYRAQFHRFTKSAAAAFEQSVKNALSEIDQDIQRFRVSGVDAIPARRIADGLQQVIDKIKAARGS